MPFQLADSSANSNQITDSVRLLTDTLIVKSQGIVQVQNVTEESYGFTFWFAVITTAIAIITTSFIIRDRIKKPEVSGKIISLTFAPSGSLSATDIQGNPLNLSGIKYFFKLSLNVIHKNIFYSSVKVFIKYPNDNKKYEGRFYFTNNDKWTFAQDDSTLTLNIPQENFISFNNVLEKDKTIFLYASFFVDRQFENFSELEFEFITPNKKSFIIGPLKSSDFKTETALFENEIWS
jgi:hypothetical protein